MIQALKSDKLVRQVGGSFRLTALIQRRLKELIDGARPMVDPHGKTYVEIAIAEIDAGKIKIDYEKTPDLLPPSDAITRDELHGSNL